MKSARHKNLPSAQLCDAEGQLQLAIAIDPDAQYEVPRFRMSIIMNETSARRTIEASARHFSSISDVAAKFMETINVTEHHERRYSP